LIDRPEDEGELWDRERDVERGEPDGGWDRERGLEDEGPLSREAGRETEDRDE
jgi:hypothetical protein